VETVHTPILGSLSLCGYARTFLALDNLAVPNEQKKKQGKKEKGKGKKRKKGKGKQWGKEKGV
jgi:hypothetical protein